MCIHPEHAFSRKAFATTKIAARLTEIKQPILNTHSAERHLRPDSDSSVSDSSSNPEHAFSRKAFATGVSTSDSSSDSSYPEHAFSRKAFATFLVSPRLLQDYSILNTHSAERHLRHIRMPYCSPPPTANPEHAFSRKAFATVLPVGINRQLENPEHAFSRKAFATFRP